MVANRERIDVLLVQRGLVESREFGRRLIMAGEVLVNDEPVTKPGTRVDSEADIHIRQRPRYVSRGGDKLHAALEAFEFDPTGMVCADVGASTGGFTDCLLQHGAQHVYAIDVGYGQLAWKLRQDDRVTVMERVNARYLESLDIPVSLVVMDVSFISIDLILPVIAGWFSGQGAALILVKPQFEAGRGEVGKGGVVRDPAVHRRVLGAAIKSAWKAGYSVRGLALSPVVGPAGNHEFLMWLEYGIEPNVEENFSDQIGRLVAEVHSD